MPTLHELPPLILHPFSDAAASSEVLRTAKEAAERLGSGEEAENQSEQLRRRVLAGRFAELQMLLFVGKDLSRWMEQCVDFTLRTPALRDRGIVEQSFAEFLVGQTPPDVDTKLRRWGVTDYVRIFSRSIGIYAQFQEPPERSWLQPEYLKTYYRFADYSYACWRDAAKFPTLSASEFSFTLFASGEYSKYLEAQWQT